MPRENGHKRHGGKKSGPNPYRRLVRTARNVNPFDSGGGPGYLQYDPAIEAERRAAQRALEDTAMDVRLNARRARADFRTSLRDMKLQKRRDISDYRRELRRTLQGLRYTARDTRLEARRGLADISREQQYGREDFERQLGVLTRAYANLGQAQTQTASAYGVLDAGTAAQAKVARQRNFAEQKEPLVVSLERLGQESALARQRLLEDTERTLGRIGTAKRQARRDTHRTIKRTRKDTRHDIKLTRRDYRRTIKDLYHQLERAIREQRIGDADLIKQEIFNARANNPGSIGKRQPEPGRLHDGKGKKKKGNKKKGKH